MISIFGFGSELADRALELGEEVDVRASCGTWRMSAPAITGP